MPESRLGKEIWADLEAAMVPARDALAASGPAAAEWERRSKAQAFAEAAVIVRRHHEHAERDDCCAIQAALELDEKAKL